ncbi:sensor histidine kinase [Clostridium butyricum]|uniref:sensor histidine kinase n=1 Tax=Clostridium butyricum TaxID=1492 RepID=UPI00168B6099
MNKFRVIVLTLVSIVSAFCLYSYNVYAYDKEQDKVNVLFISSFSLDFITFNDQLEGIKSGLNYNCDINVEYMDSKILNSYEAETHFYNLIKYKLETYGDIGLVISGDDDATEFCIKYRDDLFKKIPISFLGVQQFERSNRALKCDFMSGVSEVESIRENIELIKKLNPNVKTINFLDSYGIKRYEEITTEYKDEYNFNWIITKDKTSEEVRNILSGLDKNNAVIQLYVTNFFDNNFHSIDEINKFINESCKNAPMYNILFYDVGNGSIGGKVINHFNQGEEAGKIAIELLNGQDKNSIYIGDDSANEYVFDYKALKKFGIRKSELPFGSKIINDPIELIEEYKKIIIGNGIFVIGLLIIIFILVVHIRYKRTYEKEILKAKNAAEDMNKTKAHFIANISHELRTPINVIMSAIQLIKINYINEVNNNKVINNFNIINDNCKRLLRLINNIIDIQKSDLEEDLKFDNVNVVELIEELVMSVIPYAKSKNLILIFDTTEEELIMPLDIDKFERIILNLLSNAIKFSKEYGEIRVNLEFKDYFYIIITDDGIGIAMDNINNIFEEFVQLDNSLYRKNEGSGIGLSIVKSFVKLHNGTIFVDSKINVGSRFILKFPIKKNEPTSVECFNKDELSEKVKMELSDIYM